MNVAAPPVLRPEDFPEVDPNLLAAITRALRAQADVLAQVPQLRFKTGLKFTTSGGGTAYLDVSADPLPEHAWVTRLAEADGAEVTTAYSQTFVRQQNGLRFLFAGLSATTSYVCSVGFV